MATFLALRSFGTHHRGAILLVSAAIVVVIAVSALLASSRSKTRREIQSQMAEAVFVMQGMDHQRAALILESLLERHPGGDLGADIRYHLATAQYAAGNTNRALELFQEMVAAQSRDPIRRFAALDGIANCYEAQGDFARAAEEYERIAPEAPEKERIPYVLAQAARCYEKDGNLAAVIRIGRRLVDEFGESEQWQREGSRILARAAVLQASAQP